MTRQWYGAGTRDTLRGFLLAVTLLPGRRLSLGPLEPADVAAFGFFARGRQKDLDQFEVDLDKLAADRGVKISPVDVQDRRRQGR